MKDARVWLLRVVSAFIAVNADCGLETHATRIGFHRTSWLTE
jgi:hypothetical protein